MTDNPYPNMVLDRLDRVEHRQDNTDVVVSGLLATTAVHTEQVSTMRGDMKDLVDAINRTNDRFDKLLKSLYALVLVLIPVAANFAYQALNQ